MLSASRLPDVLGWRAKLQRVAGTIGAYAEHPRTLAGAFLLSVAYQLSWIATNAAAAAALRLAIPPAFVALMVPISDIVGLIPIFFNNLGAREGTFVVLLDRLSIPAATSLALAFLVLVIRLAISAVGGVLQLLGSLAALREGPARAD